MTTRSWLSLYLTLFPVLQLAVALFYEYIPEPFQILLIEHMHILMVQALLMDGLLIGELLQIFLRPSSNLLLRRCTSLLTRGLHGGADISLIIAQLALMHHQVFRH